MSKLLLLQYNNYYNRFVKKVDSYSGYTAAARNYEIFDNINFIPKDGIYSDQIVNFNEDWTPDYCVVLDDDYNVKSRWFIINSERTRGGQFKLGLRRDIVVDNYDLIIESPMYIEKAFVKDTLDPAIFNKEDIRFNEIKKDEILLKDKSKCPWLVAFFNNNQEKTDFDNLFSGQYINYGTVSADIIVSDFSQLEWSEYLNKTNDYYDSTSTVTFNLTPQRTGATGNFIKVKATPTAYSYTELTNTGVTPDPDGKGFVYGFPANIGSTNQYNYLKADYYGAQAYGIYGYIKHNIHPSTLFSYIIPSDYYGNNQRVKGYYKNKTIYNSTTEKYYKVEITTETIDVNKTVNMADSLGLKFTNANTTYSNSELWTDPYSDSNIVLKNAKRDVISIVEVPNPTGSGYLDVSSIIPKTLMMNDAPYCAIAFPYMTGSFVDHSGNINNITQEVCLSAVSLLSRCLGSQLYDIQLLPYCPLPDSEYYYDEDNGLTISTRVSNLRIMKFNTGIGNNNVEGIFFFNSTFHNSINYEIQVSNDRFQFKLDNETKKYKLCSPSYSNVFDMNVYMNYGVDYFNVDCTYKPYKSYIHVAPNFKGLYGEVNDQRGLIITGDFSIPQISDSWQEYQIQNKNFSNIFERGIQNLEVQNSWQLANSIVGAASGALGMGAGAGLLAAGPAGAAIGIAGGLISGAAGAADIAQTIALQKENLDYTRDLYNFNLQNIQAQPETLKSVSSLDANTRLFPFIEIWSCTETEREALSNKLRYNGMKIGRIDKMSNFIDDEDFTYIKGQLIRLEHSDNDSHELIEIAAELNKGVFI